jgi:hypothetical protein
MKKITIACLSFAVALLARADDPAKYAPPPLVILPPPMPSAQQVVYVYDQKPLAGVPVLISPEQAQIIVDKFKTNYAKLGSPRFLIYINRELVDEKSGLKLSGRTEHVETTTSDGSTNNSGNTHSVAENHYEDNGQPETTLADRQTTRDVERLIGRPLRAAGATVVDQHVAAEMIGGRPLNALNAETDQARKDREAVGQIADVAVEVLVSSRTVTVPGVAGDKVYTVPDIQMTAIRLKDAKMIGQVAASDIINKVGGPSFAARHFDVESITEATALALMDDMGHEVQ